MDVEERGPVLLVELFDPLDIGVNLKLEYFNIGEEYNAIFGAPRVVRQTTFVSCTSPRTSGRRARNSDLPEPVAPHTTRNEKLPGIASRSAATCRRKAL